MLIFFFFALSEDSQGNRINGRQKQNTYVPLSDVVTACAAHPLNGAIIAGTQVCM